MFKRFLKFFRGEEHAPAEPFEGSYLDHLLAQVRGPVTEQLAECPDHDPLLLVVVGILRQTMINAWSPRLKQPLVDSQSPGPIPAVKNPAPESASTREFEAPVLDDIEEDNETLDEEFVPHNEPPDVDDDGDAEFEEVSDIDDSDADEDSDASADSDGDDDDEPAIVAPGTGRSNRKTEEIDVEEVRQASLNAALNDTAEIDRYEREPNPDPTIEIEADSLFGNQRSEDGRPRVDSEEVLQAGRVFLGLLIENDRLPIELQLSVAETTLARDLLLGYFIGNDDFEEKARRLLTLVEQKFGEGRFSQARILLQLFHTDEQTRINNDRNLFYEDMILRLGIRRRNRMSGEELKRFQGLLGSARTPEGAALVIKWLSESCMIHLHAYNRDPEQVAEWTKVIGKCTRPGGRDHFLRYLPARRWRAAGAFDGVTLAEQLREHITPETAREYVIAQLKTCYFVLRAVGDTGLEGFLDTFFDWSTTCFELDGTRLMPELYKRSMMDPEPMISILREIYDEHYARKTTELVAGLTTAKIEEALYDALEAMGECDLGEVAPGDYDLGAFVFDRLFSVTYPSDEFPFKIHRLT